MGDKDISKTRAKGRPRSDAAHIAILDAALRLAESEGFRDLSMNAIASAANVGRATIYRRWPNKAALVMDAFLQEVGPAIAFPEVSTVAESIRLQLHRISKSFTGTHGKLIKALLGEAQFDKELENAFRERWIEPRRKLDRQILLAGIKAGELRPEIDIAAAIDEIYGAIYYRLLIGSGTLDTRYMDSLFHNVMDGLIERNSKTLPSKKVRKRRASL